MKRIQYNAPVILTFSFLSAIVLILGEFTGGQTTRTFFSVYQSSWSDPFSYLRLFSHVLGHANFAHFSANILMILVLGPMVEERYGSRNTFFLITATAFFTGIIHIIFSSNTALLGASGIVFMLIFLASLAGMQKNRIPLTLLLVAIIYFGQEIYNGLFTPSNISHLTHIIGGLCGIVLGTILRRE